MLGLTRRPGERIVLRLEDGRELTVTLIEIDGGRARLGIEAPRTVTIFREELRESFARPREEAP